MGKEMPEDVIGFLDGMADGQDDDLGKECSSFAKFIEELATAARGVINESDDAGCQGDMIVTSKKAVNLLGELLFEKFSPFEEYDEDEG